MCYWLLLLVIFSLQEKNDPMLPYVELWQAEQVDSVRKILPQLNQKFAGKTEVRFFNAIFETDADQAAAAYTAILSESPKHVFADECLYRLIQLACARGTYKAAQAKFDQLKKDYPQSKWIAAAAPMFADLKIEETQTTVVTTGKKYVLQVGAFGVWDNANDLKTKLSGLGYAPVEISEKNVGGKKLYAVWVGAFTTKDEAAKTGQALKTQQKIDFSIIEHP